MLEWFDSLPDIQPSAKTVRTKSNKKHGVRNKRLVVRLLLERDGDMCKLCNKKLGIDISVDHIYPKSLGGSNDMENLQLAHKKCNSDKRSTIPL